MSQTPVNRSWHRQVRLPERRGANTSDCTFFHRQPQTVPEPFPCVSRKLTWSQTNHLLRKWHAQTASPWRNWPLKGKFGGGVIPIMCKPIRTVFHVFLHGFPTVFIVFSTRFPRFSIFFTGFPRFFILKINKSGFPRCFMFFSRVSHGCSCFFHGFRTVFHFFVFAGFPRFFFVCLFMGFALQVDTNPKFEVAYGGRSILLAPKRQWVPFSGT